MGFTYPGCFRLCQIPIFNDLLVVLQCVLLWILDTALDDGEERLRLSFIEVSTQSKFGNLEIQTGTKWVPRCFEYRRNRGIGGFSVGWLRIITVVGNVLIRPTAVWVKFDLDIVK